MNDSHARIHDLLETVSTERIGHDLYHLCQDPLPFRTVNYTRPGQHIHSLAEADAFITGQLEAAGCQVTASPYRVQAFRCDERKPLHHWYAAPLESDPFYEICNLETALPGRDPERGIIQLIAHKDSMSWIDSPGAHDNACGTVANLELARVLAGCELQHTVRLLFCNEEHTPWTSRFAAQAAAARGDRIVAVLNNDSLDSKSDEDMAAGRKLHTVCYSTDEGRPLAAFIAACGQRYEPDLEVRVVHKQPVNDDDGSFIKEGFLTTVMNLGTYPNADSQYHLPGDTYDRVDLDNLTRSVRLLLATILEIDAGKAACIP